ncbi:hypothetical protein VitviT2T_014936 [Vitis vinifera]|uniref:Protein kinase domain-containing protein n=1 Tax=Vitis vinifera TaxID=29760 RepID=A0ABY9CQB5_VITVI|nr:hypothetical protein VitviT2T_014936 [Vitis vinifera]
MVATGLGGPGVCGVGRGLCNGGKKRRGMVATGFVSGWPNRRVGGVTAVRPPVGADKSRDMKVTVTVTVIIGTIFVAVFIYFSRRWITKRRAKNKKRKEMLSSDRGDVHLNVSDANILGDRMNQVKLEELPLVDFGKLVTATNNFDEANKLGQGGFGSVYRGRLPEGQEIAVKRLSRASAQGLEEFMNEVVVISKLQHRNLVRLLGCCIEGDEKMLIYEYMPKKSLDALLFDPLRQETLDWKKRFSIIEGIGRGLLYLHRDSRLRIIHRDLKASNILLDANLNPKISDFGMARIFGGNQDQANTIRVVGTYGYMSPEYAMEGRFSEKSDVFSFGVLLLEIVSGRRNNSFYHDEQSLSLLGYAWKLWNEDNMEALIDGSISEACFQDEILRCIHVGLLCVQELAKDRPSISTVVSMLCSEIARLPTPKKPAFTERQISKDTESLGQSQNNCSVDRATEQRRMKVIVAIALIIGIIAIAISICTYFSRRWISKQRAKKETREEMLSLCRGDIYPIFSDSELLGDDVNQVKLEELPLLDFEKLVSATNNFHEANKLGQGGFGSVYRGKFPGGQDIAVKRLSRASAQGLEEFMNEVVLISKLQHRNLVRLLGCCFKGEEKILIYEYMPNKSLDAFLFDPLKKESLNWRKRFSIIEGIGRGLLYLHRDSRLRIIHRDLKASNILLDEDLNPKISDFGMARIFGRKQDQANTVRVVGTYGYMSPEYAIEGRFSEKSDVFSFGVLLLEIVSGRRNSSFYHDEQSLSLLGYAWKLWNEDNMEALIDGSISEACFQEEILRCIHVGLLCVQELAKDRPSISTVVPMLCSEIAHLPPPKQPAFTERQIGKDTESSQLRQRKYSVDRATITVIHGR